MGCGRNIFEKKNTFNYKLKYLNKCTLMVYLAELVSMHLLIFAAAASLLHNCTYYM